MGLLNQGWIFDSLLHNGDEKEPVKYRDTHGATHIYLGGGLLFYTIPYLMKSRTCVCLGSGGGFVPRLMTDCMWELQETNMINMGEVYVVDATNGVNGEVDWNEGDSFLREKFNPKFLNTTTEDAFYNFFVKRDIKIDYLHIDADHTYEGVKKDFELYSTLMNENGIISIHDTDKKYWDNFETYDGEPHDTCYGPSDFIKEIPIEWEMFNLFDHRDKSEKLSTTGLTLLRKHND